MSVRDAIIVSTISRMLRTMLSQF